MIHPGMFCITKITTEKRSGREVKSCWCENLLGITYSSFGRMQKKTEEFVHKMCRIHGCVEKINTITQKFLGEVLVKLFLQV